MQILNVKNEYYNNIGNVEEVIIPIGFKLKGRESEINVINIIKNEFGGKIELLNEINITGHKNPDFLWNGKLWEIKSVSSKNSVDLQVRYALKQIYKNVGGIVLIIDRCCLSMNEIVNIIINRVKRTNFEHIPKVDVIMIKNNEVADVIRVKNKDIPSTK